MIWFLVTLPLMLLAVAVAVVPVLHTMLGDERARRQEHATALSDLSVREPSEERAEDRSLAA